MPLEIAYRPFTLPTGALPPAAEENVRAGDVSRQRDDNPADGLADMADPAPLVPRPRDFAARIRRRDMVSVRRRLRTPSMLRQRLAGVATIGLFALVLGPIGWGSPGGIDRAAAQAEAGALQPFEQAGESFPGSAFYYVSPDDTGLIAPNAAEQAWAAHRDDEEVASAIEPAGPAARPIFARGSGEDQWRALQCLTAAIYYEAASEPDSGQRAVAQVVLNRVAHPAFPNTVCGVVYQGSERPGCQFSFACDGSLARRPMVAFWERARRVARDALAGYVYAPVGLATHYHTSAIHPYWADSLAFIGTIGAHRFYRWSGGAGRPAAFNAVYAGGEPIAAPHPRTWAPAPTDIADPVALARAYEDGRLAALQQQAAPVPAVTSAAFGQVPLPHATAPAYAPAIEQRGGDAVFRAGNRLPGAPPAGSHPAGPSPAGTNLPGSNAIRPEYQNSGKWIAQPQG